MLKRRMSMILVVVLLVSLFIPTGAYAAKKVKAKSVTLSAKSVVLSEGDMVTLTATKSPANASDTLKWSTSNKSVATVSSKGVVQGVKEGTATVTVTTSLSKKKATCKVKVSRYMVEAEVKALIDSQLVGFSKLTLADVDAEIDKKLKEGGFITETKAGEMISTATKSFVTKSDVDKTVADAVESAIGDDWEDGTELKLYQQKLPLTLKIGVKQHITITEISIKKYHKSDIIHDTEDGRDVYSYAPFNYKCIIKGTYDCDKNIFDYPPDGYDSGYSLTLFMEYWSDDWKSSEINNWFYLADSEVDDTKKTFTFTHSWNGFDNFDSFLIKETRICEA